MIKIKTIHIVITYLIAIVWFANGFLCKVLNLVPRHQLIVGRILGKEYSSLLTKLIGASEIIMAIWIISCIKPKINAIIQIIIVVVMNTIEFLLAPDLLLWGKLNSFFALLFILLIYYNEFILNKIITSKNVNVSISQKSSI